MTGLDWLLTMLVFCMLCWTGVALQRLRVLRSDVKQADDIKDKAIATSGEKDRGLRAAAREVAVLEHCNNSAEARVRDAIESSETQVRVNRTLSAINRAVFLRLQLYEDGYGKPHAVAARDDLGRSLSEINAAIRDHLAHYEGPDGTPLERPTIVGQRDAGRDECRLDFDPDGRVRRRWMYYDEAAREEAEIDANQSC